MKVKPSSSFKNTLWVQPTIKIHPWRLTAGTCPHGGGWLRSLFLSKWVMAVGEPAVNLPGCRFFGIVDYKPYLSLSFRMVFAAITSLWTPREYMSHESSTVSLLVGTNNFESCPSKWRCVLLEGSSQDLVQWSGSPPFISHVKAIWRGKTRSLNNLRKNRLLTGKILQVRLYLSWGVFTSRKVLTFWTTFRISRFPGSLFGVVWTECLSFAATNAELAWSQKGGSVPTIGENLLKSEEHII